MLQSDVEELRTRMEEKNRLIEKKTQAAVQAVQERNRMNNELTELKDHMDIKDRKINVLQRKVSLIAFFTLGASLTIEDIWQQFGCYFLAMAAPRSICPFLHFWQQFARLNHFRFFPIRISHKL